MTRRVALAAVALAAAAPLLVYLWVAAHRIGYPYELDWMEGGSVGLAARAAGGHSLYAAPSLAYVGWTYTPLYYWVSAAVGQLIGVGFLTLRLVSLVASLGAMATLAWIVRRDTGVRVAGLLAAGLFAATFRISGAWLDTGRVDSLFVALTLLAVAWGRSARGVRGGVGLGVLAFLAFFTKQIALVALVPLLGYLLLTRRAVGVAALLTLLGLVAGSTVALEAASGGWYGYYVLDELAGQAWAQGVWVSFWTDDVLGPLWPLAALILAGAVLWARRAGLRQWARSGAAYYGLAAGGLIAAAWLSRLHTGGYANVLMPAYAAIALLAGLAAGECLRGGRGASLAGGGGASLAGGGGASLAGGGGATLAGARGASLARISRPRARPRGRLPGATAAIGVAVVAVAQAALLAYPIAAQLPTSADRAAGAQLLARLRALPGNVVVLRHPWYAAQAGKGSFAHGEAITDVLRSSARRGPLALSASLRTALDADHVDAVVLDGRFDAHLLAPALAREFRLASSAITDVPLYPLTDLRTAPRLLYVRVRAADAGAAGLAATAP